MTYLIDTNVCIAVLNNSPKSVQEKLRTAFKRGADIAASAVTGFELWYGAFKSRHVARNSERLAVFFSEIDQVPLDEEDARIAGRIRAELERAGQPIGPYDLLIAAQAVRHDCTLVTGNMREFSRVDGLRIENWIDETTGNS